MATPQTAFDPNARPTSGGTSNPQSEPLTQAGAGFNITEELQEFTLLKRTKKFRDRNFTNMLLREAMEGRFRWPNNWPNYKTKLVMNIVKPITLRAANLLMGKGLKWQVPPLSQDKEERIRSQAVERGLDRIVNRSGGVSILAAGAQDAALLGDAVFKTYLDEKTGWPKLSQCLPDYFYGIPASTNYMGDLAKVYYAYFMDPLEAKKMWPELFPKMKTEDQLSRDVQPDNEFGRQNVDAGGMIQMGLRKRIPVVEIWTEDNYALIAGGQVVYNAKNPYGFVPFTSIPNIRISGQVEGQGDAEQVLSLNEELNQILSHRAYVVRRWLNPTLIWEGAPPNYKEIIAAIVGGGGAIPTRMGAKLDFLQQSGNGPDVNELIDRIRGVALENANTNELALTGQVQGSINTGQSLDRQLLPVTTLIEDKKRAWEIGLKRVASQLLTLTQQEGAAKEYGSAYVPTETGSKGSVEAGTGAEVPIVKELFVDYKDVEVVWPGTLASDDASLANLEIKKYVSGIQSLYTTLENLGFDFPSDEIERMKDERNDPDLHPEIANQALQAASPLLAAQQKAQADAAQNGFQGTQGGDAFGTPPQPVTPVGAPGGLPPGGPTPPTPGGAPSARKGRAAPPAAPAVQVDAQGNPVIA